MGQLVLCGEGSSDFGSSNEDRGALADIVIKSIEYIAEEKNINGTLNIPQYITKRTLTAALKNEKQAAPCGRKMRIAPRGEGILRDLARLFAKDHVKSDDLGIFHSDVDFTRSISSETCYTDIQTAIGKGFDAAGAENRCIALIARPRTEAWLYILTPNCPHSAQQIERMPGNDNSPNSLKALLKSHKFVTNNNTKRGFTTFSQLVENHFNLNSLMKLSAFQRFYNELNSSTQLESILEKD